MKNCKKLVALVLAVMLALTACSVAFATSTDPKGNLTINNAEKGQKYTIYRIFDAEISGDATNGYEASYTIKKKVGSGTSAKNNPMWAVAMDDTNDLNEDFLELFEIKPGKDDSYVYVTLKGTKNATSGKIEYPDDADILEFIEESLLDDTFAASMKTAGLAIGEKEATSETLEFDDIPYGYYAMKVLNANQGEEGYDDEYTYVVNCATPQITVSLKNERTPSNPQKSEDQYAIKPGNTITYQLSFKAVNENVTTDSTTGEIVNKLIEKYTIAEIFDEDIVLSWKVDNVKYYSASALQTAGALDEDGNIKRDSNFLKLALPTTVTGTAITNYSIGTTTVNSSSVPAIIIPWADYTYDSNTNAKKDVNGDNKINILDEHSLYPSPVYVVVTAEFVIGDGIMPDGHFVNEIQINATTYDEDGDAEDTPVGDPQTVDVCSTGLILTKTDDATTPAKLKGAKFVLWKYKDPTATNPVKLYYSIDPDWDDDNVVQTQPTGYGLTKYLDGTTIPSGTEMTLAQWNALWNQTHANDTTKPAGYPKPTSKASWVELASGTKITDDANANLWIEVDNDDETIEFEGLTAAPTQSYYMQEIFAPVGYELPRNDWRIDLEHDTDADNDDEDDGDLWNNPEDPEDENHYTMTMTQVIRDTTTEIADTTVDIDPDDDNEMLFATDIVNTKAPAMPVTGGTGTTMIYIIGSLLLVGAAILLITRKRMA